ncbi:Prophage PSPPH06, putative adenine modification methytransferase [Pseudomonas syringae pv. syringae]|nr:Prophage PSPPH06, putative adenine modification methytransferase [Pseudomonas syringae pv. syringae]
MRPQAAPVEVLNDINGDLVTLYRVVQNHLEEFARQFKWALSARQVFEWQKMTRPERLPTSSARLDSSGCSIAPYRLGKLSQSRQWKSCVPLPVQSRLEL